MHRFTRDLPSPPRKRPDGPNKLRGRHSPEMLARAERIAELRAQGLTGREIAAELGLTESAVWQTICKVKPAGG